MELAGVLALGEDDVTDKIRRFQHETRSRLQLHPPDALKGSATSALQVKIGVAV